MDFPDWAGFTPEFAAAELPRLIEESEKAVAAIEAAEPKTYEEFVWPLDDATRGLWQCWGMVAHELGVMNSEAWRKVEEEWQPKIVAFGLRVSQSKRLYEAAKEIRNRQPSTAAVRCRILDKMIQSAELAGVGLEGERKDRFNEIQMKLAKLGADFHNAVIDATAAFRYEKDGKTYTIDDANYPETMKHCADREVREKLYRARATRAPENEPRIEEILKLRQEEAEILGFGDYAAKSLATKCAPGVAAVMKMIDDLDAATVAKEKEERKELGCGDRNVASPSWGTGGCGDRNVASPAGGATEGAATFLSPLRPWDLAYEAERLRERKYAYSEEELKRHFELEDVVKGLFRMAKFLFDVDVEEVADKPSVWHEDVRFFKVVENGETIAHFYFDPFVRPGLKSGGAWMNEFRNRSARGDRNVAAPTGMATPSGAAEVGAQPSAGETTEGRAFLSSQIPLAVVVTNFPEKDGNGKCYLPFREVETLFHEFGHALQCMLTRIDEEDAAGINLVEWDAVEVASQFMENWCLDDRTGISVPAELKAKVRAAKNFRAATACRRQLAFAQVDMWLHLRRQECRLPALEDGRLLLRRQECRRPELGDGKRGGGDIPVAAEEMKKGIFNHFGLPMIEEDRFLCAFTHIFAGGYAAGYYGYKWAEVMSADCFGAFEEVGLADDAAMRRLGMKYRETVLALGGSKSALEVFRDFRGRDPEISALLRQQDLI